MFQGEPPHVVAAIHSFFESGCNSLDRLEYGFVMRRGTSRARALLIAGARCSEFVRSLY
jgi:hypothetical protein